MKRFQLFPLFAALWIAAAACTSPAPKPTEPAPTALPPVSTPAGLPQATPAGPTQPTPGPAWVSLGPMSANFLYSADSGWQSTGFVVRQGQQVEVRAEGLWNHGPGGDPYGAAGSSEFDPDALLPTAPIGALIGRIGYNPPFVVGEHADFEAEKSGELWLGINDRPDAISDNTGILEVAVTLGAGPEVPSMMLTNDLDGYRFLAPFGYQAVIYQSAMCLTQTEAWMLACHVANLFIDVSDSGGLTLAEAADEIASQSNPTIEVRRTEITVSGEPAVLLDDIYGVDVMRKVVILHDGRLYVLTFLPWNEQIEDNNRMAYLYETVVGSFAFLSPPESEARAPEPVLRADRVLVSYSPDGAWKAEAWFAHQHLPEGNFAGIDLAKFVRLTVFRLDGSQSWMPIEEWSGMGLGETYINGMYWSPDGQSLYLTDVGVMHPCGAPFVERLRKLDLSDGSVLDFTLSGSLLGNVSFSPDVKRMVYHTDDGLLVTDLETGESTSYPFDWPAYSLPDNYAWSPDGGAIAFNYQEDFCGGPGTHRSSIMVLDLATGTFTDRTGEDLPVPLILGWPEPGRLLGDRDGQGYYDMATGVFTLDPALFDRAWWAAYHLGNFLAGLNWGDDPFEEYFSYEQAASLYGGSLEVLLEMNPEADPEDRAGLLRLACTANGFMCLRLREVLSSELVMLEGGVEAVRLVVSLMNPDGSVFALGPCCGEDAEGDPQTAFTFTVVVGPDSPAAVLELPPYVP